MKVVDDARDLGLGGNSNRVLSRSRRQGERVIEC
jgi:hypothetical protein